MIPVMKLLMNSDLYLFTVQVKIVPEGHKHKSWITVSSVC